MVQVTSWVHRGAIWTRESDSTAVLTRQKPTSFLPDFDYSITPFPGCPFGCEGCYVKAFLGFRRELLPNGKMLSDKDAWGSWVERRVRSEEILRRALDEGKLDGARLFLTPTSDAYAGNEEHRITRQLLKVLAERPVQDWLLINTRSQL